MLNNSQRLNEPETKPAEATVRRKKTRYILKNGAIASNQTMTDCLKSGGNIARERERGAMEAEGLKLCIKYSRKDPKL